MKSIQLLSQKLCSNAQSVIENLSQESIDVYLFLKKEFESTEDIRENSLFHFVFRSFYRLDNAGLSDEIKLKYFKIMSEVRRADEFDFKYVCDTLYQIPNIKGQNSLQFSFTSKMANMINPKYPIYDSEVAAMFDFRAPYGYKSYENRLEAYLLFYKQLTDAYSSLIESGVLTVLFDGLTKRFHNVEKMSQIKKLDFLLWSAGKLKKAGLLGE